MRRTTGGLLVLGALIAIGAVDVAAQDQDVQRRDRARGPDVEAIMQLRERLALTENQIAELDVVRRESVARRSAEMAEMAELRSRLRAGQIRRSEVMARMEERRDANQGLTEERRARVESILTDEQLTTLDELQLRRRAFRRGRQSARRGPRGDFDGRPGVVGRRLPRRPPDLGGRTEPGD
jgi:Spy/CpxP family protein refolding chaperone